MYQQQIGLSVHLLAPLGWYVEVRLQNYWCTSAAVWEKALQLKQFRSCLVNAAKPHTVWGLCFKVYACWAKHVAEADASKHVLSCAHTPNASGKRSRKIAFAPWVVHKCHIYTSRSLLGTSRACKRVKTLGET